MLERECHHQVIAALALLDGVEEAGRILDYLSPKAKEEIGLMIEEYSREGEIPLEERMRNLIRNFEATDAFSGISEIHPAWLLDALKEESPRVIGVILRHLPSKHVRYLLEHLPRHIVCRLPKLMETFYVQNEILNVVRRRFERHFVPILISHRIETFTFAHLYYLKIEELESLFFQLGLSELALSLVGSPINILRMILNRFGVAQAKEIQQRMKRHQNADPLLLKDARYSVLEQKGKEQGAKRFLTEIGILALAKAFGEADDPLLERLKQKLIPELAYLLKRFVSEQPWSGKSSMVAKRQEWVLQHLRELSTAGGIDPVWAESLNKEAA